MTLYYIIVVGDANSGKKLPVGADDISWLMFFWGSEYPAMVSNGQHTIDLEGSTPLTWCQCSTIVMLAGVDH